MAIQLVNAVKKAVLANPRSVSAGAFVILVGGVAAIEALNYPLGTPGNLGPGALPLSLGLLLIVLGGILMLVRDEGAEAECAAIDVRALCALLAAIVVFALVVGPLGILPASFLLIMVSGLSSSDMKLSQLVIVAVCASLAVVAIFVYLLGMPFTIIRWP